MSTPDGGDQLELVSAEFGAEDTDVGDGAVDDGPNKWSSSSLTVHAMSVANSSLTVRWVATGAG